MDTECSEFDRKLDTVESIRFHHEEAEEINRSMDLSLAFWGRMDDVSGVIPATKLKCFMKKPSRASEIALLVWRKITEAQIEELKFTEITIMKDGEISAEKLFQVLKRVVEGTGIHLDEVLNDDEVPVTESAIRIMNELLYMYNHNEPLTKTEEYDRFASSYYFVMEPDKESVKGDEPQEDIQGIRSRIEDLLQQAKDLELGDIKMPSSSLSERSKLMIIEEQVRAKIRIKGIHKIIKEQKDRRVSTADNATAYKNRRVVKAKPVGRAARQEVRKHRKVESSTTQCRPVFKSAVKPREIDCNSLIRNVPDLQNRLRRVSQIKKQLFEEKLKAIENNLTESNSFEDKEINYNDLMAYNQYLRRGSPYKSNSANKSVINCNRFVNKAEQDFDDLIRYTDEGGICNNERILQLSNQDDIDLLANSDQRNLDTDKFEQMSSVYMTEEYEEENVSSYASDKTEEKFNQETAEALTDSDITNNNFVYLDSLPEDQETGEHSRLPELNLEMDASNKEDKASRECKDSSNSVGQRPISREEMLTEMKKIVKEALQEMSVSPNPTIWSRQELETRNSISEDSAFQSKHPSRPSTSKNEEEATSSEEEEIDAKLSTYNCYCEETKVGIERVVKSDMEIVDIKVTQENLPQHFYSIKGDQESKISTEISVSSSGSRPSVKVSVINNVKNPEEYAPITRDNQHVEVQEALTVLKNFLQTNVPEVPLDTKTLEDKKVDPPTEEGNTNAVESNNRLDNPISKEDLALAKVNDVIVQEEDSLQETVDLRDDLVLPTISVNLAMMLEDCAYSPSVDEIRSSGPFQMGGVLVGEHLQSPITAELIGDGLEYRYPAAWTNWQNQVWLENFSRNSGPIDGESLFVNGSGSSDVITDENSEQPELSQGPMILPSLQNSRINEWTSQQMSQSPIRTVIMAFGRVFSGIVTFATLPLTFSYDLMNNSVRWILRKNRANAITESN